MCEWAQPIARHLQLRVWLKLLRTWQPADPMDACCTPSWHRYVMWGDITARAAAEMHRPEVRKPCASACLPIFSGLSVLRLDPLRGAGDTRIPALDTGLRGGGVWGLQPLWHCVISCAACNDAAGADRRLQHLAGKPASQGRLPPAGPRHATSWLAHSVQPPAAGRRWRITLRGSSSAPPPRARPRRGARCG